MTATLDTHEEIGTSGYLALWDAVAAAVPDRDCLVQGERRQSWAQTAERTQRLGWWLSARTEGFRGGGNEPWESPNELVGIYLRNRPEFLETALGCYRARCAPFNINYRYRATELAYLLRDAAPVALVYQQEFAPVLREALAELPGPPLLICVADDSGEQPVSGSADYERILAEAVAPVVPRVPSGDDVHVLYTGGTTGMPKGVIWRQRDVVPGPCGITVGSAAEAAQGAPRRSWLRALPAPPLMHGTALWYAYNAWANGGTVVLSDDPRRFDAAGMVETLRREQISSLAIVGDVFARPLLDALAQSGEAPTDLKFVLSSGAVLSDLSWSGLKASFPKVHILNTLGSSETGPQAVQSGGADSSFVAGPNTVVLDEQTDTLLTSSRPGRGLLANGGHLPRGYLHDPERTQRTFRTVAGRYLAVSGDRAEIDETGAILFLGRDATVINTGGEKVYAEEVEAALLSAAAIEDVLVLGRPSPRWGNEVVALVVPRSGGTLDEDALRAGATAKLAGYKVPKAFLRVERIRRFDNGKPDYGWARAVATRGNEEKC